MPRIAWIALGGALGTVARYYVSIGLLSALGPFFPYGTLAVNLVGSLLLGGLFAVSLSSEWIGPTLMLALTTGFMGGFTTYSTFSLDAFKFLQTGSWGLAAAYVGITVVGCLLATWLGFGLGTALATAGGS